MVYTNLIRFKLQINNVKKVECNMPAGRTQAQSDLLRIHYGICHLCHGAMDTFCCQHCNWRHRCNVDVHAKASRPTADLGLRVMHVIDCGVKART